MRRRPLAHLKRAPEADIRRQSLLSLDAARVLAMAMVALHHAISLTGFVPEGPSAITVGQIGVTIFCGLSGYLSVRCRDDTTLSWLGRRLRRIYPPYWLTLIAVFAANAIVQYKPMPADLMVSEFLGTALFTHPTALVGVHFWFISLILLCYSMGALVRLWPMSLPALFVAVTFLLRDYGLIAGHLLSFLVGIAISSADSQSHRILLGAIVFLGGAVGASHWHVECAYPAIASVLLVACSSVKATSPRWLHHGSYLTYEFFLVHGPIFLFLSHWCESGIMPTLLLGTMIAIPVAIALHLASAFVVFLLTVLGGSVRRIWPGVTALPS